MIIMNRESMALRAIDQSLSTTTVFVFIFALIFLAVSNIIFKRLKKTIRNKWLTIFSSAWLSGILMLSILVVIIFLIKFISEARFGTKIPIESGWPIRFGIPETAAEHKQILFFCLLTIAILIISFVASTFYTLYHWLKEIWINKIKSRLQPVISSVIILILINLFLSFFLLKMRFGDMLVNLAIWSPIWTGTTLAFLLYEYFLYFERYKTQQQELQIVRLQQQVAQSQLDALSSKINPHFLYNSLNSIAGLATEDGLKTREMAISLAKLFRYNINREENSYATVKEEMEMVSLYLEIEKIRFEERLQYTSNIEPGLVGQLIPKHLLQPLVENAVKHGAGPDGIFINVTIKKQGSDIILSVQDKGKAFDTDFNPGYGLKSLYDKLDILAPGKYEIAFLNDPKEVRIKITDLKIQAL